MSEGFSHPLGAVANCGVDCDKRRYLAPSDMYLSIMA